ICSMTLVPKPQGQVKPSSTMAPPPGGAEAPGLSAVDLSADRVQLIGMRTAPVKRETLGGELRTVGVVAPSERGLAQISIRFSGWIEKLLVSETGERVRRGQVLATVYSPEVLRAEQELLVARGWTGSEGPAAEHHGTSAGFSADARRRMELLGISAQEVDQILRTGKPVEAISIRSPVEGYVVAKRAVAGQAIAPGTVLFEVANLSTVWVTADVYESDLARVHVNQPARLELTAYPGETHTGRVQFIYPMLDPASRTLRIRVEFKNRVDQSGPRLRPGMSGTIYLSLPAATGLMVPAEALVDTGELHYLFVAQEGGHFQPRQVKVGARARDRVEILSGVSEGETVVTTGNFLLDSESRLRAAIEGQSGAAPASGGGSAGGTNCSEDFDAAKYPDKARACKACELQHRGMGSMEEDCKKAIARPWR
ncbi:MAG TPA: efflux RND transporter periplasmic adaptor subunit, partial [Polyangia bacterium]|nr:efflux RND transporter periplasmic adaptor subunit [Polyangia bacterium]